MWGEWGWSGKNNELCKRKGDSNHVCQGKAAASGHSLCRSQGYCETQRISQVTVVTSRQVQICPEQTEKNGCHLFKLRNFCYSLNPSPFERAHNSNGPQIIKNSSLHFHFCHTSLKNGI